MTVLGAGNHGVDIVNSPIQRTVLEGDPSPIKQFIQINLELPGGGKSMCTATIIGEDTVLTAAHCAPSYAKVSTKVGGTEQSMKCVADRKFPEASYEDEVSLAKAKDEMMKACKNAGGQRTAELQSKEEAFNKAVSKVASAKILTSKSDLALCKLTKGKFDVPPAKIGTVEKGSNRYKAGGFGCTTYEPKPVYPDSVVTGAVTIATVFPGTIWTKYVAGDPKKSGLCGGDSGGPLFEKTGGGITLVGVNSAGSTTTGEYKLDPKDCTVDVQGREKGIGIHVNLASGETKKFFAEAAAQGFNVNGGPSTAEKKPTQTPDKKPTSAPEKGATPAPEKKPTPAPEKGATPVATRTPTPKPK